jgi:hypothetical protein
MKGDFSRDTFNPRKHYAGVLMQQGRVQIDADWNEQQGIVQHRSDTQTRDVIGESGAPIHNAGFQLTTPDRKAVTIGAGRYYVGGLLCENETAIDYTQQPDLPGPPAIAAQLQAASATVAILYLEAWHRAISALDDAEIREVALGGPDTAIRSKTVWQVKALPVKPAGTGAVSCGDSFPEWDALVAPGSGLLSVRSQPTSGTGNLCLLPPSAGYQRLENQLYRVEIHQGGAVGTATFKWSRDNGSVVTAIESFNGQQIVVHDLGRDAVLGFSNGQTVELVDDLVELGGQPGQLFQIDHVVEASRTVVLTAAPAAVDPSLHPKLRRWDAPLATVGANLTADGWTVLEDGVQVQFRAGTYLPGDYWTFAARTVTANVDWPFTTPQPPQGGEHHRVRLGIATLAGDALSIQDCRKFFTPLAEIPAALHITGISWVHDDVMAEAQLQASGLQIFFDAPLTPPPGDAGQAVVTVTLEAPVPLKALNPAADAAAQITLCVPLHGDLSFPTTSTMLWKPSQGGSELSNLLAFLVSEQVQRARLRVHLRGSAIWFDGSVVRSYLDGRTLGQDGVRAGGTPRVDLLFPSGEGRRSSDFDSWLYVQLQLPPAHLVAVSIAPPLVNAGTAATGTVTLDHPAPAAGVTVTLASSSAAVVVPASVMVPAGATSATFNVTTAAAPNTLSAIVTAAATGATLTAPFTVQVVTVALSPTEVTIFAGHSQQFSATVTGSSITSVTWSVQEAAGASVNASGLVIGQAVGDYHIVATSTADPIKSGTAITHVRAKGKDKEKEKEKDKDKEREKFTVEKVAAKELERLPQLQSAGGSPLAAAPASAGAGRAFIAPAARPALS